MNTRGQSYFTRENRSSNKLVESGAECRTRAYIFAKRLGLLVGDEGAAAWFLLCRVRVRL